jgi:hypothetical protein
MNNNDYDRCMFYVYEYKDGKGISELSNDTIKPSKLREYIRWGLFLEPSIIKIRNDIITRDAKNEMLNYDHKFQLNLFNDFPQNREQKKLKKNDVESFANRTKALRIKRNIKTYSTNSISKIKIKKHNIDPIQEFTRSINVQIENFTKYHNYDKTYILQRLLSDISK